VAELVKDNLFFYVLKDKEFGEGNIEAAIRNGCKMME